MIILIFLAEGTSSDECTYLELQGRKNDDIDHDFNLYYYILLSPSQFLLPYVHLIPNSSFFIMSFQQACLMHVKVVNVDSSLDV